MNSDARTSGEAIHPATHQEAGKCEEKRPLAKMLIASALALAWLLGWIHIVRYSTVTNPADVPPIGMTPYDVQDFHGLQVTESRHRGHASSLAKTRYVWERGYHRPIYPRVGWSVYFGPFNPTWRPYAMERPAPGREAPHS